MQESQILLVEPESTLLARLRDALCITAHTVIAAPDAQQALQLFHAHPTIDLALIDESLPGINGFALCAELRKRSNLPIILLGESQRLDDMVRGFDAGADDYLAKPITLSKLTARIDALLRRVAWLRQQQPTHTMQVGDILLNEEHQEVRPSI